jgi:hypothetical protein
MPSAKSWITGYTVMEAEVTEGTAPVTVNDPVGFVVGGQVTVNEGTEQHVGAGYQVQNRPGELAPDVSIEIEAQTLTFPSMFFRAAGDITTRTMDLGVNLANAGVRVTGAAPNALRAEAGLRQALRYTGEFPCWDAAQISAVAEVELSQAVLMWHQATVTLAAAAYYAQRVSFSVDNQIERFYDLDAPVGGVARRCTGHDIGVETVEFEIDFLSPYAPADLTGDTIAVIAAAANFVGDATINHAFSNLTRASWGFAIAAQGLWIGNLRVMGIPGSLVIS